MKSTEMVNCPSNYILRHLVPVLFGRPNCNVITNEAHLQWVNIPTNQKVSFAAFSSIDQIFDFWQANLFNDNLLLDFSYLKKLEENPIKDYQPWYLLLRKEEEIVGIAYCQSRKISPADTINWENDNSLNVRLKKWLAGKFSFNMLFCGNLMFTGEHGFTFDESQLSREEFLSILGQSMQVFAQTILPEKIHVLGIKDLDHASKALENTGFFIDPFLPSMHMAVPQEWQVLDDYLSALSSKYRVRAKRAFKKAKDIVFLEMSEQQIIDHQAEMMDLYKGVVSKADFNIVHVSDSYFIDLKRSFPSAFRVFGCFENQKLVGFYTSLKNGNELEAHYLGFDASANRKYQLYLNILFRLIEIGIEEGVSNIVFARTSMTIKSSVGAVAVHPSNYVKHNNRIMNRLLPRLIHYFEPKEEWEPRHPFKSSSSS